MSLEDGRPNNAERTKAAWDNQAHDFWQYDKNRPISLNIFFTEFFRKYRDRIKDVLDIGCGSGRFLIPMVQDGKNVTGLDISSEMLFGENGASMNLRAANLEGKAVLREGMSTKLDFPDASFDFVLAKGSIHHNSWVNIEKSFREVARILRPGTFFLFQGRSTNDSDLDRSKLIPDVGSTVLSDKFGEESVIQHYFTREELERLADENGFEIITGPEEKITEKGDKKHARWWVVYRKV